MSASEKAAARERLGLDSSVYIQYIRWVGNAARGNFGISYKYRQDVSEVISRRLGNTLMLGGISFALVFILALLLGWFCARFEDRLPDRILCKTGTFVSCIPEFWLSLVLIFVFAVTLGVLPGGGAYDPGHSGDALNRLRHLVLPVAVLVMSHFWYYAYPVRNMLLEQTHADYVLTAKAKGMSSGAVMLKHCIPNIIPSYISFMAVSVPHILSGTYIVEAVFSYPGLGTLAYESARYGDYNLLMVICLLTGTAVILSNMTGQAIMEKINPAISAQKRGENL